MTSGKTTVRKNIDILTCGKVTFSYTYIYFIHNTIFSCPLCDVFLFCQIRVVPGGVFGGQDGTVVVAEAEHTRQAVKWTDRQLDEQVVGG